ncbi:MAG: efflux RND transporter permease subunit [Clostridium fessum]
MRQRKTGAAFPVTTVRRRSPFRFRSSRDSTDMEVSSAVKEKVEELMADDSDLTITVANDTSDTILDSLKDVAETMVLAVIISMFIIFLFFGDYKASLIVGSSIPTSILMSLIAITMAGFSLNVITMSALGTRRRHDGR